MHALASGPKQNKDRVSLLQSRVWEGGMGRNNYLCFLFPRGAGRRVDLRFSTFPVLPSTKSSVIKPRKLTLTSIHFCQCVRYCYSMRTSNLWIPGAAQATVW